MPATFIRHQGACVCACYGETLFSSWVLSAGFYEVFPVSRTILKKGVSVLGSSFKKRVSDPGNSFSTKRFSVCYLLLQHASPGM